MKKKPKIKNRSFPIKPSERFCRFYGHDKTGWIREYIIRRIWGAAWAVILFIVLTGCTSLGRCFIPTAEHLTGVNIPNSEAIEYPLFYQIPAVIERYRSPGMEYRCFTRGQFTESSIFTWLWKGYRLAGVYPISKTYSHAIIIRRTSDIHADLSRVYVAWDEK